MLELLECTCTNLLASFPGPLREFRTASDKRVQGLGTRLPTCCIFNYLSRPIVAQALVWIIKRSHVQPKKPADFYMWSVHGTFKPLWVCANALVGCHSIYQMHFSWCQHVRFVNERLFLPNTTKVVLMCMVSDWSPKLLAVFLVSRQPVQHTRSNMAETDPPVPLSNHFCDANTGHGDTTVTVCGQQWEGVSSLSHWVEAGTSSLEEKGREQRRSWHKWCHIHQHVILIVKLIANLLHSIASKTILGIWSF